MACGVSKGGYGWMCLFVLGPIVSNRDQDTHRSLATSFFFFSQPVDVERRRCRDRFERSTFFSRDDAAGRGLGLG